MKARPGLAIVLTCWLGMLASCSVTAPAGSLYAIYVHGRVTTVSDSSLSGVRILLGWRPMSSCTATFPTTDSAGTTDASGRYGILLIDTNATQLACVKVIAVPSAALPFVPESAVVPNVTLTTNFFGDSVGINIVLPPK